MPSISLPNINIPEEGLKSKETMENILDTLQKYRKELNFLLMNLDLDNMPTIGNLIGDIEGDYSLISQTVDGIILAVGSVSGDVASLQLQADAIIASVSDANGAIAALVITAEGIQTQVTNQLGDISILTQTADELAIVVADNRIYTDEQLLLVGDTISTINTTITDQYTSFTQRADAIELAASNLAETVTANYSTVTGDITTLATTVTDNQAAIDLRADGIVLSVSSVSTTVTNNYNALTGEIDSIVADVDDAYAEISLLADDITLKVSKTDYTGNKVVAMLNLTSTTATIEAENINLNGITHVSSDLFLGDPDDPDSTVYLRFGNGPLITAYYGGYESKLYISAATVDFEGSQLDFTGCDVIGLTGTSTTMKFA